MELLLYEHYRCTNCGKSVDLWKRLALAEMYYFFSDMGLRESFLIFTYSTHASHKSQLYSPMKVLAKVVPDQRGATVMVLCHDKTRIYVKWAVKYPVNLPSSTTKYPSSPLS